MIIRKKIGSDKITLNVLPPAFGVELFKRWVQHSKDFEDGIVGLDVETTAIDDVLGPFEPDASMRMIQFGSRKYGWAFDPHDPTWRPLIAGLLADPDIRFVSHTNYDPLWVKREFDVDLMETDRIIDTFVMANLLFPGVTEKKDLKDLSTRFIDAQLKEAEVALHAWFKANAPTGHRAGIKAPKAWGFTNVPLDQPEFAEYAGLDAVYVRRLLDILAARIRRANMTKTGLPRREQRIQRWATSMRIRGMKVDPEWTRNLLGDVEDEFNSAYDYLADLWGFSPESPKRGDWLIDHGVRFIETTKTGLPKLTMPSAASAGTLLELQERYKDDAELAPVFDAIVTVGGNKNFLRNLKIIMAAARNDGRVHPEIKTQAAHTGRMSIVKPAMQTLKKRDPRLRGCFVADDGYTLVGADYASQEIRIALAFSHDELLGEVIANGLNQHLETTKRMFGVDNKTDVYNIVTGQTFYDVCKTLDFAQQYGAMPKRIAAQLGISLQEAKSLWNAWRKAYAGLVSWTKHIGSFDTIVNPYGRRIPADPWRDYATANYAIQSTGRDILGAAMERLGDAGWADAFWIPVHDELVLMTPEDEAEQAAQALTDLMTTELMGVPIPATGEILGSRWGQSE